MKKLWLDIETTGLDPKADKIIEFAFILEQPNVEDKLLHSYVFHDSYPDSFLEEGGRAKELTHLTPELLLEKGISEHKAYKAISWFLSSFVDKYQWNDKYILAGYNVGFDDSFLRELFIKYNDGYYGSYIASCKLDIISILAEKICDGKCPAMKSYKLQNVTSFFGLKDCLFHSALEDIEVTRSLYKKLTAL